MCRLVCRLIDYSWSSSCYLVHTVWDITEGEAKEEIRSSVHYLLFISTSLIYRKNRSIRQSIVGFPGDASGKELPCQCRRRKETRVQFLSWENPLEQEMATHSSFLSWKVSRTEELGVLQSIGSKRIRPDTEAGIAQHV